MTDYSGNRDFVHRPELVDDDWAWVTDAHDDGVPRDYGPTGTVHLADCPQLNANTILRRRRDTDPIVRRCGNCLTRLDTEGRAAGPPPWATHTCGMPIPSHAAECDHCGETV